MKDTKPSYLWCFSLFEKKFCILKAVVILGNGVGYSIEGNRCALKVYFHLEKHIFIKLPPRLQAGGGVKLIPILVNHGKKLSELQLS